MSSGHDQQVQAGEAEPGGVRVVGDEQRVGQVPDGEDLGIEVVGSAADGNEALALAIRLRPDVVLMDLRMPRCDGIEATRRLREACATEPRPLPTPTSTGSPEISACRPFG